LTRSEAAGGLGMDVQAIFTEMADTLVREVTREIPRAAAQVATKFLPGLGMVRMIVTTGQWLLGNVDTIRATLAPVFGLSKADFEWADGRMVREKVAASLPAVTTLTLDLMARQFGLSRVKKLFRDTVADLPGKIEGKIKAAVKAVADRLRLAAVGGAGAAFKGQIGQRYAFEYNGKTYQFIVARQTGTKAVVVRVILDGKVVTELTEKQINDNSALPAAAKPGMVAKLNAMLSAARSLDAALQASRERAKVKKAQRHANRHGEAPPPPSSLKPTLATQAKALRDASTALAADLHQYGCAAINAGCFAAGTKLWTPAGQRNVEDIQVGDLVFSRNEYDPAG